MQHNRGKKKKKTKNHIQQKMHAVYHCEEPLSNSQATKPILNLSKLQMKCKCNFPSHICSPL